MASVVGLSVILSNPLSLTGATRSGISAHHLTSSVNSFKTVAFFSSKKKMTSSAKSKPASAVSPANEELAQCYDQWRACGVTLSNVGENRVVTLALENGTSAKVILPAGLITSFRAKMWHGATMELLHTTVGRSIQGGLSLAFQIELHNENNDNKTFSIGDNWALHRVSGTPQNSIQVELISIHRSQSYNDGDARLKHVITLGQDSLSSNILVSNLSTLPRLHLTGSVLCHLAASTPDATFALGLQGSDFFVRAPLSTNFSIIPPRFNTTAQSKKFLQFLRMFEGEDDDVQTLAKSSNEDLLEGEEEDDDYKNLGNRLSRVYTSAPRNLTIIDRGRRNSVMVERNGFRELYMLSPGSKHEYYNKYSYICIGHAALLEPIIVDPQSDWRGSLRLSNPNS